MTNKISVKFFVAPFFISALLVCIAVPILLPIISQQPQIYEDIAFGWISLQNLNKSGELRLLYILIAASMAIVVLWFFIITKRQIEIHENKYTRNDIIVFFLLVPCLAHFCLFSITDGYLLLLAALAMTLAACKKLTYRNILLMVVVYFGILAVTAATMPLNATPPSPLQARLMLLSVFVFVAILLLEHYICKKATWLAILALQILIPLILLYFLHDQYNIRGELTKVDFDRGYIYTVSLGIAVAILYALYSAYATLQMTRSRELVPTLNDLILPTTAIAIFVFNSVNSPLPMLRDWHHTAEHMVPFQQIIDFDKILYGDFWSASGAYPIVFGFVQRFLLNNTVASYYQVETLLGIVFYALGGLLLNQAFGKKCALFVAVSLIVPQGYTRILPLLPFLLILMVPRIVANKHLWLQIYVVCSMLLGLYYPLYGGAYLLCALPFALVQTKTLLCSKQSVGNRYHIYAYCFVMILVFICSPLLLRLAKYVLMMSSATLLRDGMSVFDHNAPHGFLAFIYSNTIRKILYLCVLYYLQILCVIIPFALCVCYIFACKKADKYRKVSFFTFSFAAIMLLLIYTYSQIGVEYGTFMFKTWYPFSVISIVLFGSLWRYGGEILTHKGILACLSFLMTIHFLFIGIPRPHAEKLFTPPTFSASWRLAPQNLRIRFPRLGAVILASRDIDYMNHTQALLEKIRNVSAPLLELPGQHLVSRQLSYFLFNKESSVMGTVNIYSDTTAQMKAIDIMKENPPICFAINSVELYVLYRWILGTDYLFSDAIAIPRELAQNMPSSTAPRDSNFYGFSDLGNRPNAFGKSLSTLMPMFVEQSLLMRTKTTHEKETATVTVDFERTIDGREVDFIFVDVANNNRPKYETFKSYFEIIDDRQFRFQGYHAISSPPRLRVRASWAGEDGVFDKKKSMEMAFGNGKLLMPLGANPWWLTGEAKTLKLEIYGNIAEGESFSLNEIKLLQFKPTAEYTVPPPLPELPKAQAESE